MSLVLHKILGAIRIEDHILSGINKIERYALNATSSALIVREILNLNGILHMNGKATHILATQLAMGYTSALHDVYKLDKGIPRSLELRTIEDVKMRPSYIVGENLRFIENELTPELSAKLDKEANKVMTSTNLDDEITPAIVEKNPVLKNIFNRLSGKTIRTMTGTLIKIGIGVAAVCIAVNERRNRLTACMLFYYEKGQLRQCVIETCTCKKVTCTKDCNFCSPDILEKYLPADMLVDNCGDFKDAAGCVKCPSDDYSKLNINDDKTLTADNVANSSFVRCQRPDFFDALSDLFGGVSEDLMSIIKGSLSGISWIVKLLPYVILCSIIGVVIIILISLFGKLKTNRQLTTEPSDYNIVSKTENKIQYI